jgi:hypothetical protein
VACQNTGESKSVPYHGATIVFVKTTFKNGSLWTQVVFDPSGKIEGLFFKPEL